MSDLNNAVASGLNALMNEYNSVAHNLANSSTAGYKRRVTTFSTQLQTIMDENFTPLANPVQSSDWINFMQGPLRQTERSLDVAIEGKGFLVLETPEGRLYTRNGAMQINILGQLTDMNGHLVAGKNGAVTIPRTVSDSDIQINNDGVIRAGQFELGKLEVVEFEEPVRDLELIGNSCYRAHLDADPQPAQNSFVRQGYQEQSNVQAVSELTNLLGISRIFEANVNFLKKQSQNTETLLNVANS